MYKRLSSSPVLDLISRFESLTTRPNSAPPETPERQSAIPTSPATPIRNQNIHRVGHRVDPQIEKILQEKSKHIAMLERSTEPKKGFSGGILIGESTLLVSKHSLNGQSLETLRVRFPEKYRDTIYTVSHVIPSGSPEAIQLGLLAGPHADFAILVLNPNEKGLHAGINENYTRLGRPSTAKPHPLIFVGFTSGTGMMKCSFSPGRPIELPNALTRRFSLENHTLTWNDFGTHGTVTETYAQGAVTTVEVQSPSRARQFIVEADTVYRESGKIANEHNEFYILHPNIYANDHVRLAHRSTNGSSGGVYFTEDGEIFALHTGRIPSSRDYPEHIAYFPWTSNTCFIYNDPAHLIRESRFQLTTLKEPSKTIPLGAKIEMNGQPLGHFRSASKKPQQGGTELSLYCPGQIPDHQTLLIPFKKETPITRGDQEHPQSSVIINTDDTQLPPPPKVYTDGLFRVSTTDLQNGNGPTDMPIEDQKEFAKRLSESSQRKHSLTHAGIKIEHITIGASQQNGKSYHFVDESDGEITFHMTGCHHNGKSDTYSMQQWSAFFTTAAEHQITQDKRSKKSLFRL